MDDRMRSAGFRGEVLVPDLGMYPPATLGLPNERIFHIALRSKQEKQPGLARALMRLCKDPSCYADVDWQRLEEDRTLGAQIVSMAHRLRPTVVFMQIQRNSMIGPEIINAMRDECDRNVVIINWDGDQHYSPGDTQRKWFVELGKVCDCSLVVNTSHPAIYAEMGVRNPGYFQIGIDRDIYFSIPGNTEREIVFLGSAYRQNSAYAYRRQVAEKMHREFGDGFSVYGYGWQVGWAKPWIKQEQEREVYASSRFALSMSITNKLPRYSSDRLFRALACGATVLVQRFPDMEGVGLVHGTNCLVWETEQELVDHVRSTSETVRRRIGSRAEMLALSHTWHSRMYELAAIIGHVRRSRE